VCNTIRQRPLILVIGLACKGSLESVLTKSLAVDVPYYIYIYIYICVCVNSENAQWL
jgi:hypothetical protein